MVWLRAGYSDEHWFRGDRPRGATIFSFIGGLLIVGGGVDLLLGQTPVTPTLNNCALACLVGGTLGYLGVCVGCSILVFAMLMNWVPTAHSPCGIAILLLAPLSLFGGAGFLYGLVCGIYGGVLGIIFVPPKPMPPELLEAPGTPLPRRYRTCSFCEVTLPDEATTCPNCGHHIEGR